MVDKYTKTFTVRIGTKAYRCRALTRRELRQVGNRTDPLAAEQILNWACSSSFDELLFGTATRLAEIIVEKSILESPVEVYQLEMERLEKDLEVVRSILICTAFPQYTFEMLDELGWDEWIRLSARANWKLVSLGIIPMEVLNQILNPKPKPETNAMSEEAYKRTMAQIEMVFGSAPQQQGPSLFDTLDDDLKSEIEARIEETRRGT